MKTLLHAGEREVLTSKLGLSSGSRADLFPTISPGTLTLTNERLIFEAERADEETSLVVLRLDEIGDVGAGWIKLLDLIPLYPALKVVTGANATFRFAAVSMGTSKPKEWVAAINGVRANFVPSVRADSLVSAGEPGAPHDAQSSSLVPPAMRTSQAIDAARLAPADDLLAWIVVAVPLVGATIELLVGKQITLFGTPANFLLFLAANTVLCFYDAHRLRSQGHEAPDGWWSLIVPVYLWKRAALLGRSQLVTLAWIASFAASLFVSSLGGKTQMAETACPVVTQIIQQQLNGSASCKRVAITDDLGGGFYTARAVLDNGRELRITIENRGSDIYVQIPPQ